MKKMYVKPEAETIDFTIENIIMNDIFDGSDPTGTGSGQFPEDGD